MNSNLSFVVPQIDCVRRNYSPKFQDILNVMLQRDPKKRQDLTAICRFKILEPIYMDLKKEEFQALNKQRWKVMTTEKLTIFIRLN